MKKLLLTGVAFAALATSPAMAEGLKLDLGGHFKGYVVFNDNDEDTANSLRDTNIRKETEVHFTGETTLDSGLTVGVHVEAEADDNDDFQVDESYMYLSGGWGRVNFGEEDGVAYLLQVAAPSADSNIDGLRQYINTFDLDGVAGGAATRFDYDHVAPVGSKANKITYMTPVFSGFQAGVSYVPALDDSANGLTSTASDEDNGEYDDAYEVAFRYEGAMEGVGIAFGAGYGMYGSENDVAGSTVSDDADIYNVGFDLDFGGFGFGAAYLDETTESLTLETEAQTYVVGVDYQMGAYKLGASYYDRNVDVEGAEEQEIERWTAGVNYAYGPGMSFRGSVSFIEAEESAAAAAEETDSTQVFLGTQVNF